MSVLHVHKAIILCTCLETSKTVSMPETVQDVARSRSNSLVLFYPVAGDGILTDA